MIEYCDLKIEVMKPSEREIEKLKKRFFTSDWGYRVSRHFGWPIFVLTRRLDTDKYVTMILSWALKPIRAITKKVIRVDFNHHWSHEYKGRK
jgi:hypothetical protein